VKRGRHKPETQTAHITVQPETPGFLKGHDMITINGNDKANKLTGTAWDEQIFGLGGNDTIEGGGGLDDLFGGEGNDKFLANSTSAEDFDGGAGKDTIDYSKVLAAPDSYSIIDLVFNEAAGLADGDTYRKIENVTGSAGADAISGSAGANLISGAAGEDFLRGRGGKDQLIGGEDGDYFAFGSTSDSGVGAGKRDVIKDYNHAQGDGLDISAIDADVGQGGKQEFTFVGSKAFTAAGQVRSFFEGDHTIVEVSNDGDNAAEMQIELSGRINLTSADFVMAS
jgi:Ca2+-binding RTX toxin-like protein